MTGKELIGKIFFEEEETTELFKTSKFRFFIKSKEGTKPHLHFKNKKDEEGCIRIDVDDSFNHQEHLILLLNNRDKRELAYILSLPSRAPNKTNYQLLCSDWNNRNIYCAKTQPGAIRADENSKIIEAYSKYLTLEDKEKLSKIKGSAFWKD